mgnify:CR=1 FL=1
MARTNSDDLLMEDDLAAAFLGDDSPLLASGTYRRSGLTSNTELLTVTYRENWLAKKIIDMPSEDMTRSWYSLSTSMPEEDIHDLKRLEAKHSVKQEITNAIKNCCHSACESSFVPVMVTSFSVKGQ